MQPMPGASFPAARRRQFLTVLVAFCGLGFNVGAWAVLLADITTALHLSPASLGITLSCFSLGGIVTLMLGARFADRVPRRGLLFLGSGGVGVFLLTMATVHSYPAFLAVAVFGGVLSSVYDLAVNTVGGDYERAHATRTMTLFHAGFSGGAAAGAAGSAVALAAGMSFRAVFIGVGGALVVLGCTLLLAPLGPRLAPHEDPVDGNGIGISTGTRESLLRVPGVLLALLLVSVTFFGDGALEGYTSVYLRVLLGSGALVGGLGIAAFHLAGVLSRVSSTPAIRRFGERHVLTVAGIGAALGITIALATAVPLVTVGGLLLVGFSESPVVPAAFSLAGRYAGRRGGQAVATVNAAGYSAFIVSPLVIGALANAVTLRGALVLLISTTTAIAVLAQRLPRTFGDHGTQVESRDE